MINFKCTKIKVINITFPTVGNNIDYHLEQVTEGLSINENGDIKITINPKSVISGS